MDECTTKQTQVYDIQTDDQKTIRNYIEARKTETNLASSTQKVMIDNLIPFPRYTNKNFKDFTRDDVVSFLNNLRRNETEDPQKIVHEMEQSTVEAEHVVKSLTADHMTVLDPFAGSD